MMTLKRFRVTNFRSIDDSNWIETDDVTALMARTRPGRLTSCCPYGSSTPPRRVRSFPQPTTPGSTTPLFAMRILNPYS